jgi:hypothetical protein
MQFAPPLKPSQESKYDSSTDESSLCTVKTVQSSAKHSDVQLLVHPIQSGE